MSWQGWHFSSAVADQQDQERLAFLVCQLIPQDDVCEILNCSLHIELLAHSHDQLDILMCELDKLQAIVSSKQSIQHQEYLTFVSGKCYLPGSFKPDKSLF